MTDADPSPIDAAAPSTTRRSDDEFELIDLLGMFWDRRWLIAGVTACCGLVGFGLAWMQAPLYEAAVTMLVSQPKLQQELTALPTSVPNLRTLIENRSLAVTLLREVGLESQIGPAEFVTDRLQVRQIPNTSMLSVHVRLERPDLAARAANRLAELAIGLNRNLNQQETVETRDFIKEQLDEARARQQTLSTELIRMRTDASLETLRAEISALTSRLGDLAADQFTYQRQLQWQEQDEAGARLAEARDRLLAYQKSAELPRARKALETRLLERERLEEQRTSLGVAIEGLKASSAESASQMEGSPAFLDAPSSIVRDTPASGSAARLRPELVSPLLNPTRQVLEQDLATSRSQLSGARQRLVEVDSRLATNGEQLVGLQATLADKESVLAERERDFELARDEYMRVTQTSPAGYQAQLTVARSAERETRARLAELHARLYQREVALAALEGEQALAQSIYQDLANDYEQARLRVAGQSVQLQVVDPAVVPHTRVSPRKGRDTLLGLLAGAVVSTILAFLVTYIRATPRRV